MQIAPLIGVLILFSFPAGEEAAGSPGQDPFDYRTLDVDRIEDLYGHSIRVAEETCRRIPGNALAIFSLARVHERFGQDDKALEVFRRGLALDPNHPDVLSTIGYMLSQRNEFAEATEVFRKALRLDPGHSGAHSRIGLILIHEGKLAEAVEEFRSEIQNRTASSLTFAVLGHTLRDLKKFPEAILSYKEAIRLNPEETGAYYGLSQVYRLLGDRKEEETAALDAYRKWKAKDDENLRATTKKGGNREAQLHRAAQTYAESAQLFLALKRNEEGLVALRGTLLFDPNQHDIRKTIVNMLRRDGKLDEAFAEGEKLISLSRDPEHLFIAAGLFTERKLFSRAGELLEEAVRQKPKDGDPYRELARLILSGRYPGDQARALDLARQGVEQAPAAPSYDVYGWALYKADRKKEAQEALEIALRLDPGNAEIRKRYENIQRKMP